MHTLCLPVSTSITEVINGADQQAIVSILSKMGMYSQDVLLNINYCKTQERLVLLLSL